MITRLNVTDDSGFIAIANADKYLSFVNKNWKFPQLLNHFIDEMNKQAFIVWATGLQNTWTVTFMHKPTDKKAFREFSKSIDVSNGQLFLTNYEDLTMAAQFDKEKIPANHNSDLCIKLGNGKYILTIRQMFDPENYEYDQSEKNDFEIITQVDRNDQDKKIDKVFWWTD